MEELEDTQSKRDDRNIGIDKVGVSGLKYPVRVKDKNSDIQHTVATISLSVELPHHFKGTHMSRFVEVLNSHGKELNVTSMHKLPSELLTRLEADKAQVQYKFDYFREKSAPVTKKNSLIDSQVIFDIVSKDADEIDFVITVIVPVTTLCPCSKSISKHGAHNQRGLVEYSVRFSEIIWIDDLIEIVEKSASSELYSLLKRPDEKFVTEQAYENPVFVEDLVRNIAKQSLNHNSIVWYKIKAENFESIHNHNAFAEIEKWK